MSERLNILYLHNKTGVSGGERSLLNLWENLDGSRFKLYLAIPGGGEFEREARKLGVNVLFLEVPGVNVGNLFEILKVLSILIKYIRKNRINIIHSYTPRNNILSVLAGKISGIPVVWHERNLIFGGEADLTKRFLFLPDRVICNSRAVMKRFEKNGKVPSKVRTILNGVDLDRFNPAADGGEVKKELNAGSRKIVGVLTNLSKRKRVEYFLQAASLILRKSGDVLFLVVGGEFSDSENGRMEELKKIADKSGLGSHVIFTGFKRDVTGLLASFDISAHVTEKEACSRAIIESMAAGKPVVAMDDGGNSELVENGVTGVLVKPDDINGFAAAVLDLLDDDAKRIRMGQKAKARAEELFDVKRNAGETERVYLELA